MKKYLIFALSMLTLASCGGKEGTVYKLEVDTPILIFAAEGTQTQTVNVTAENVEWTAELNDPATAWLHIEKRDGAVAVTVDNNTATTERTAKFTVKSNTADVPSKEVTVMQIGTDASGIYIGTTVSFDMEFSYDGGAKTIAVTAADGLVWSVAVTEGGDWVTCEKNSGGFIINVTSNMSADPREAKVVVTVDGVENVVVTVKQTGRTIVKANLVTASSYYMGDYWVEGAEQYMLNMYNEFVEVDGMWIIPAPGAILFKSALFGDAPADLGAPEITAGTYTISESAEKFTAYAEIEFIEVDGMNGIFTIEEGQTFTLERSGDNYVITIDNVILNNGVLFSAKYSGVMDVQNGLYPTQLTGDVLLGEMSGLGSRIFRGDFTGNETYMWGNVACGEGINMTPEFRISGNGSLFDFCLFTDQTDSQHIADGTYTISNSQMPGTAYNVLYMEIADDYLDCEATMYKGEITVTHEGENYRLEFDVEDVAGHAVTGVWEGEYGYVDRSSFFVAPQKANVNYTWKAPALSKKSNAVIRPLMEPLMEPRFKR